MYGSLHLHDAQPDPRAGCFHHTTSTPGTHRPNKRDRDSRETLDVHRSCTPRRLYLNQNRRYRYLLDTRPSDERITCLLTSHYENETMIFTSCFLSDFVAEWDSSCRFLRVCSAPATFLASLPPATFMRVSISAWISSRCSKR